MVSAVSGSTPRGGAPGPSTTNGRHATFGGSSSSEERDWRRVSSAAAAAAAPGGLKRARICSAGDSTGDDNDDGDDDARAACAPEWEHGPKRLCEQQQQQHYRQPPMVVVRESALVPELSADCAPLSSLAASRVGGGSSGGCGGVRIDDLLNPVAGSAAAPALAAAHRMTVPTTLSRSRSADSKHYYQQLVQLQLQLQSKQPQQQLPPIDPTTRFARTATAPSELTVVTTAPAAAAAPAGSCTQGLIREALALDKLYDIACVIIESIWPNHSASQRTQLCSLRCFVAETHRQSRLGPDALELAMFYLLRAKSIIQAKQRAELQKEEEEQQQQQQLAESQNKTMLPSPLESMASETSSIRRMSSAGSDAVPMSAAMEVPAAPLSAGTAAVPSGIISSPLGSSPITPDSVQQAAAQLGGYAGMDKQHQLLLANGVITPITPEKPKRLLAASTHPLPSSFSGFVVPTAAIASATALADNLRKAPPATANSEQPAQQQQPATAAAKTVESKVTKCGRRMFVAALISASKFMYDQTYPNKAWNKITKLPPRQICDMERAFLDMIDYRLYVDQGTYDKFHRLLARSGMRNGRLMVCDASAPPTNGNSQPADMRTLNQYQQQQQQQQLAIQQQLGAALPSPQTPGVPMSIPPTSAFNFNATTSV
ncbi:PHO85 cyclin-5 [Coemansia biformis]|uniref:PHO85 cyclin-5 n=1 Tax=Coemansia biformis TaxID=1286918 RepID=A0A9W7YAL6_9FUNG|nr:PHO85 cyclin-5 [Coemansia biformis]